MRAEATVEVLCLLSDFKTGSAGSLIDVGRIAVALIPILEGTAIGGCRLQASVATMRAHLSGRWRRPPSPYRSLKRRWAESSGMKTSGYQSIVCAGKGGLTKTTAEVLLYGGYGGG